jgi:Zn-dependent protease with chaperone function
MPFLLMVFLTLACLPDMESYGQPSWVPTPARSALYTGLGIALMAAWAFVSARRLARAVHREPGRRELLLARHDRWRHLYNLGLYGLYILAVCGLGWGWAVRSWWRWDEDRFLPAPELALLAPFLISLILSWAAWYDADRALHETSRKAGRDQTVFHSRLGYVLFQARQKLALVLIPVLLLIGQKELRRQLGPQGREQEIAVQIAGVLLVLALFVAMPWIIRLVLGLQPLPPGPLRDRLFATARRLRFRCSNILLWNTRNGMANAMVVGILPWIRYVVFTDRLLDDFTPEEVEAVLGHEIGHIKHHHMLYYLGFLTASMAVLGVLISRVLPLLVAPGAEDVLDPDGGPVTATYQYLEALPMVGALLVYVFVVFGFLSRRCERQADIYGCRAVSCGRPDCVYHLSDEQLPAHVPPLCATGIRTFIHALEKVAALNGIPREKPGFLQSWQHSTIARRVAFLQDVLEDPEVERAFQRRVALVKWGLFLALGVVLGLLAGAGWMT